MTPFAPQHGDHERCRDDRRNQADASQGGRRPDSGAIGAEDNEARRRLGRRGPGERSWSPHKIVAPDEWLTARIELLKKEKELTRLRDAIAAERRELPWVKIEKAYVFDAPEGPVSLADLFDGRSQLVVKHYMMAPGQTTPCVGCAFEADHVGGALVHLNNHDVSYAAVARAPIGEIEPFRRRMGWEFRFVSSFNSDFNYDFNVSFPADQVPDGTIYYNYRQCQVPLEDLSGRSVFHRTPDGEIFHTYSSYGRGGEELLTTYAFLDITPFGRREDGPHHSLTDWVRPHDRYDEGGTVEATGRYHARPA